MKYEPTTASAIEFANENKLEEWIHFFYAMKEITKLFQRD